MFLISRLEQRNWGKDAAVSRIHPLLPQRIRAITYIGGVNRYFYKSEESFYFLPLLGADDVLGADDGQTMVSVFIYLTPVNMVDLKLCSKWAANESYFCLFWGIRRTSD